jgi:AcrR family transcriptional regulator
MTPLATGRPGRPAAATKEAALALATERFIAGKRVDIQAIARELGLARATMHRWFHTREALLGEVVASIGEQRLAAIRTRTGGRGAKALLATFDAFNREIAAASGLRTLVEQEQERSRRILTSSEGIVQPRLVAAIQAMIEAEVRSGAFRPDLDEGVLAYAIVRLAEAFLYNDAVIGMRGDTDALCQVEAALLGVGR